MQYKLHRIAPNADGWARPSPGRLGQKSVGDYVRENGFGHEDWNFNLNLAADGNMLGYTVARPANGGIGEQFGVILATYDSGGWRAAGYYDGATYIDKTELHVHEASVEQMAADVFLLARAGQTTARYRAMTLAQLEEVIRRDFIYFCWSVPVDRVHVFREPLPIPQTLFDPGKQRMMTPFNLTEHQFRQIAGLGTAVAQTAQERTAQEGARTLKVHKAIERDRKIVADFKAGLTSLACSVCGFDFGRTYGERGRGYIECHHTKPVATMKPGDRTRLSDLSAVCANCHRMIHHSMPMPSCDTLRRELRVPEGDGTTTGPA